MSEETKEKEKEKEKENGPDVSGAGEEAQALRPKTAAEKKTQQTGGKRRIHFMTMEAFRTAYPLIYQRTFAGRNGSRELPIRFCKAERIGDDIAGTIAVPDRRQPLGKKHGFAYCLLKEELIFIDRDGYLGTMLEAMEAEAVFDSNDPAVLLFDVLEYLVEDDMLFLQEYEGRLMHLEDVLQDSGSEKKDFEKQLLKVRRELTVLSAYYDQLCDMGEIFEHSAAEDGRKKEEGLFGLFSKKAARLRSMVQMQREYSLQLREMYQTEIDLRQNQTMKVLTVVTTVFMPLTLITGWYGMNFVNMRELQSPYGYPVVILCCLMLLAAEIWFFKSKKWF